MKLSYLVGIILGSACLALLTMAGLVFSGMLTGVDPGARTADTARPETPVEERQLFELPELEQFTAITERPLFNESRRPEASEPPVEDIGEGEDAEVVSAPLDVTVRGIIITPDVKVALLTDNRTRESMRLKEGMPLEGDMAGWTLTEIQPRKLVFDGDSQGQAELELQVHNKALAAAPTPTVRPSSPAGETPGEGQPEAGDDAAVDTSAMTAEERAEEIRRRVAERREQLRAEAERRRQLQQAEEQ